MVDKSFIRDILDSDLSAEVKGFIVSESIKTGKSGTKVGKDSYNDIIHNIDHGVTLQAVGDKYDVTRERIRQIYKNETDLSVRDVKKIRYEEVNPEIERPCEVCGLLFKSRRSDAVYCSNRCRWEAGILRNYTLDQCEACFFYYLNPTSGSTRHRRFCSKKCQGSWLAKISGNGKKSSIKKTCCGCTRRFKTKRDNRKFCSWLCYLKFRKS